MIELYRTRQTLLTVRVHLQPTASKHGKRLLVLRSALSPPVLIVSASCLRNARLFIVHGSPARAGKVKSQTPKVDKQEKKKTPKGRAKKRILYNRRCVAILSAFELRLMIWILNRFVNVTTLPGGKRRM